MPNKNQQQLREEPQQPYLLTLTYFLAAQTATVGRVLISKMFTNLNKRNKRKKRNKRRLLLLYQMDDIIFPYLLDSPFHFTFAGVRLAST